MSHLPEIKPQFRGDVKSIEKGPRRSSRLAVLVLGMHRSGTSAVAGLISKLGIGLPEDLIGAQANNQKGFFESSTIMLAHERLLAALGSSWSSLDDLSGIATTPAGRAFVAEMREYLEVQFGRSQYLVLKDPRMCRILETWLPLIHDLNADVLAVHVLRNPLAVSASLLERNDFSPGRSILIWLEHVLRAERRTRGLPRLFVNFDDILSDWRVFAERFEALGIVPPGLNFASRIEIESFLSDSIRHHKFEPSDVTGDQSLPAWVRDTFAMLEAAARCGDAPEATRLDRAFDEYDLARRLFNDVARDHQKMVSRLGSELSEARSEADGMHSAFDALKLAGETEAATLRAELDEATAREAHLAAAHVLLERDVSALRKELAIFVAREAGLLEENQQISETTNALRAELDRAMAREAQLATAHTQLERNVAALREELATYVAREAVLAEENQQFGVTVESIRVELDAAAARETNLAAAHAQLERDLSALRVDLAERTEREPRLARALEEAEQRVAAQKAELAERDAREAQLSADLQQSEKSAASLRDELFAADAERSAQLQLHETAAKAASDALGVAQRESDRHREEVLRQRRRADELFAYNQYLERNVRELENTVREIRASTSWRITAPLRRAMTGVQRARRTRKTSTIGRTDAGKDGDPPAGHDPVKANLALLPQPGHTASPAAGAQAVVPRAAPVDIIIPVYRGLATTAACIESVLASRPGVEHEIVIIDDCSPEPEVSDYVASLAGRAGIIVLRNDVNLGFVGTVNRGMALHPERDVVLLNSDTEVANDWLRRMVSAAYSGPRVSSVTPFSNNATICSYPRFCEDNLLPDGLTLNEIDAQFAEANASKSVEIPTAVGFCMFIRRDCLDEIGSFDEEAFGKGYGEENDFCLRALHYGWIHLLATDTFVFHKGGVSFKETAIAQQAKAAEVIRNRWPNYFNDVAQHVARDPEKPFRIAATALRYKRDARQKILIVTHAYGGGVERHIDDLKALGDDAALFLTLRPLGNNLVSLESRTIDGLKLEFDLDLEAAELASLLSDFGVTRLHIHHTLHYAENFKGFVDRLGLPFDFTIHDYFTICPRIHLGGTSGMYCGEPGTSDCNVCIRSDTPVFDRSITAYRQSRSWLLTDAARVIAPSHDTAQRIRGYVPAADIQVVPHVSDRVGTFEPRLPGIQPEERMRILVLGVVAPHKGLSKIAELIEAAEAVDAPLEVHLLGMVQGALSASARFVDHGSYEDADLAELINDVDPHLIWFPAQVPETFSYTLEAALASGRPIATSDLGALPERIAARAWSWVWPWSASGVSLLDRMNTARGEMLRADMPPPPQTTLPSLVHDGFYQLRYFGDVRPIAGKRRRVVAVDFPVTPTACGQIRVALPLTHPSLVDYIQLDILPLEEALRADADALLVQRNAVVDPDAANRLADHCDRHGSRKLFEIDDDLFSLPDSHPEKAVYEQQMQGARAFVGRADSVIVTTQVLADRMRAYNPSVTIIPNNLDDRLWFSGGRGLPRLRRPGEKLRVAFVGGATHQEDLDLIAPALREVMRRRPGAVEFHMVGATFSDARGLATFLRLPPAEIAGRYVRFVDWLRRSADWHVGLAPLVQSEFNASKSPLKFLDYGALGLAGIYSDGAPFKGVVEQGVTGLLAADGPAWTDALIRLIDDEAFRMELAMAARAEIRNRHTLSANAADLRRIWLNLLG